MEMSILRNSFDWLSKCDRFMVYLDISDEKMARLNAFRLRGGASTEWQRLSNDRLKQALPPIRTRFWIEQLLQLQFLPPDYD